MSGLRLARVGGAILLFVLVYGPVRLLLHPAPRLRERWNRAAFAAWCRAALRILRIELRVEGTPPRRPFLLVSNHLSYVDVVVLGALLPAAFVAKREVRSWPVVGACCAMLGTLFVDRESRRDAVRVDGAIARHLGRGGGVVLFPEGTSSAGATVLPYRAPLLASAAAAGIPVHGATLHYATPGGPPAADAVCWWGDAGFLPHLAALVRVPRIVATVRFGADAIVDDDRKRLAARLHARALAEFVPVDSTPHESPTSHVA